MNSNLPLYLSLSNPFTQRITTELREPGFLILSSKETYNSLAVDPQDWEKFAIEWNLLTTDQYMADGGTYRLRRYSHFELNPENLQLIQLAHGPYQQSATVNVLNGGIQRYFDPCTPSFCNSPVLTRLLKIVGNGLSQIIRPGSWDIKLHPYRIRTSPTMIGNPAPEGRHRDGVTFIMTMMINRHQIQGGESQIYSNDGKELTTVILKNRGDIILSDDRATMHAVSPITIIDTDSDGFRDVLVVAFTAREDS